MRARASREGQHNAGVAAGAGVAPSLQGVAWCTTKEMLDLTLTLTRTLTLTQTRIPILPSPDSLLPSPYSLLPSPHSHLPTP